MFQHDMKKVYPNSGKLNIRLLLTHSPELLQVSDGDSQLLAPSKGGIRVQEIIPLVHRCSESTSITWHCSRMKGSMTSFLPWRISFLTRAASPAALAFAVSTTDCLCCRSQTGPTPHTVKCDCPVSALILRPFGVYPISENMANSRHHNESFRAVFVCVCVWVGGCVWVWECACACACACVCVSLSLSLSVYLSLSLRLSVCLSVCLSICLSLSLSLACAGVMVTHACPVMNLKPAQPTPKARV